MEDQHFYLRSSPFCCCVCRAPSSALLDLLESERRVWDAPLQELWAGNFTALLWEASVTSLTSEDIGMLLKHKTSAGEDERQVVTGRYSQSLDCSRYIDVSLYNSEPH